MEEGIFLERLDKILSNLGYGSRKEIKAVVRKGMVTVDGKVIRIVPLQLIQRRVRSTLGMRRLFTGSTYIYL